VTDGLSDLEAMASDLIESLSAGARDVVLD